MQHTDLRGVTQRSIEDALFLHGELEALHAAASEFVSHGVESRKAKAMVSYCENALSQTWRILQQQRPGVAVSPADFAQESGFESHSVFQTARKAHAVSTNPTKSSRWLESRRKVRRRTH